jgi:hypothetical protein
MLPLGRGTLLPVEAPVIKELVQAQLSHLAGQVGRQFLVVVGGAAQQTVLQQLVRALGVAVQQTRRTRQSTVPAVQVLTAS